MQQFEAQYFHKTSLIKLIVQANIQQHLNFIRAMHIKYKRVFVENFIGKGCFKLAMFLFVVVKKKQLLLDNTTDCKMGM